MDKHKESIIIKAANESIIIKAAKDGKSIPVIRKQLLNGKIISDKRILKVINTNKDIISDFNTDHVINLDISYCIASILISNGYTSINELKNIIDDDMDRLYTIDNITNKRFELIVMSVLNYYDSHPELGVITDEIDSAALVESQDHNTNINMIGNIACAEYQDHVYTNIVDEVELGVKLLDLIYCIFLESDTPKERIADYNEYCDYTSNNIFYNDKFILIKVNFIRKFFDEMVSENGFILKNCLDSKSYFNKVICSLGRNNIVWSKVVDGKTYNYHRFFGITGNRDNYIKIFIDKMEMNLNKIVTLPVATIKMEEPVEIPYQSDKGSLCINVSDLYPSKDILEINTRNVFLNYCKRIDLTHYVLGFTELKKQNNNNDPLIFDNDLLYGSYVFDPEDIESGQLLLPPFYSNNELKIKNIKRDIIKLFLAQTKK